MRFLKIHIPNDLFDFLLLADRLGTTDRGR
jgi:hypothetical protein